MKPIQSAAFQDILNSFTISVKSVYQVASFDRILLETTIQLLESLNTRLRDDHGIDNPLLTATKALENLRSIRQNDSLRPRYQEIFNQCGVFARVPLYGSAYRPIQCRCDGNPR